MRLRAFGIASAVTLAAAAATVTTGIQHASAACSGLTPSGPVTIYQGSQIGGTGATAVGICVSTGTAADGGHLEAGVGNGTQAYVVAQGSSANNIAPNGADKGYAGLSDYETGGAKGSGPQDGGCPSTPGSGSNSGGSYGIKTICTGVTLPSAVSSTVPLVVCGNQSGSSWGNTPRDGCWVP
jgi:hypothetical protein